MMGGTWLDLNLELDLLVVKGMEEDKEKNVVGQPINHNNSESSSAQLNEPQRAKNHPPVRAADRVVFQREEQRTVLVSRGA